MEYSESLIRIYNDKSLKTMSGKVVSAIAKLAEEHTGLSPYKEQVKAAKELVKGNIVDMKTGEGKSLAVLLALLMALRNGRKVYIVTSNDYLSTRDFNYSKELLEALGFTSVNLKGGIGGTDATYEKANAIYATGETLIFDYLRGIKADYDFTIIDEVDYILVESAGHDFSVSEGKGQTVMPVNMFIAAKKIADFLSVAVRTESIAKADYLFDMQEATDVIIEKAKRTVEITNSGYEKINILLGKNGKDNLWIDTIISALEAKYLHIRDEEYIVENGQIVLINSSNGRKSPNGSNGIMLQTAIEVKEGLPVTKKDLLCNTCSFPVFFSLFKMMTGLSGTTSYVPYDFDIIFGKRVKKIKEHFPNQRKEIYEYFKTEEDRECRIKKIVAETDTPVLVITRSDKESSHIKRLLQEMEAKNIIVLDNMTLDEEEKLLQDATEPNAVLISSNIVGRGTDITTKHPGGLTVIIYKRLLSERAERQAIGRTGRNGKPGTCYVLTCSEDLIFDISYSNKRKATKRSVRKLQNRYEQTMFDTRKHIYARSKLFFDQDTAIKEKLNSFKSFNELKEYVFNSTPTKFKQKNTDKIILLIDRNFKFNEFHNKILVNLYEKKRPYYQAQFIQYNDEMASTLYSTDLFYERCKEYINTGNEIIQEIIYEFLVYLSKGVKNERHY